MQELYARRAEELKKIVAARYAAKAEWAKANPELAAKMEDWFAGKAPVVNWDAIEQKPGAATRAASATVLGALATQVENMIVSSADLSNSDKTDGFLKKTHAFTRDDFSGAFLQAGVSELTMACCCIGMALHGGVIPACATFFVFSDYMKPAARMAALMEVPVKFIWTHDAFRVGEDGPTHEPVEQEAQIRLLEKLKNHKGHSSMLVLRPADAEETTVAWRLAMENTATPTALIFSRQNIANLPAGNDYNQVSKGAYIVAGSDTAPDVVLVASGSEVSTLVPEPRSYVPKESKYVLFQLRPKGFSVCKARNIKKALFLRAQKYSDLPPDCPLRSKGWWVPTVKYSDSNRLVSLPLIRSLMRNWDLRHKMFMTK